MEPGVNRARFLLEGRTESKSGTDSNVLALKFRAFELWVRNFGFNSIRKH